MKTGNRYQGVAFHDKKQGVREAAQEGAANILEYGEKLPGNIAHPFDQDDNRLAEASAQPGGFACIPILRLDQLRPCGRSEDNRIHQGQRWSSSAFKDAHVMLLRLSSSNELIRRSSSASCAPVKGSCCCSRLSQSCAMSARRSVGRQTNDLIRSQQFHASQPTKKQGGGQGVRKTLGSVCRPASHCDAMLTSRRTTCGEFRWSNGVRP